MQKMLMASLIGLAVCTGNAFSPALAAEAKQPNLVIIMADDLGYGDLATYGHQIVKTPNIDRLAQEGVKFTDYYAPRSFKFTFTRRAINRPDAISYWNSLMDSFRQRCCLRA